MYKTAFEVAQLNGYKGTKEEWMAKLQGPGESGDITCRVFEADKVTRDGRMYPKSSLDRLTMKREYTFPPVILTEEQEELMRNVRASMRDARFSVPVNPRVSRSITHLDLDNVKNLDPNDIYAGISKGKMPDFRILGVEPVWDPKAKHYTLVPKLEKFESNFNPHTPYFYHECGHFIIKRQMRIEKELKEKSQEMIAGATSQYTEMSWAIRRGVPYFKDTDHDSRLFSVGYWHYLYTLSDETRFKVPDHIKAHLDTNSDHWPSALEQVMAPTKRVQMPIFHPFFDLSKLK